MENQTEKQKKEEKQDKHNESYEYMDLLSDNASQAYPAYLEDAAILNQQINSPNVFNVAVVAKYGAGKSSVIDTYLSKYRNGKYRNGDDSNYGLKRPENPKKNKYARISLATFGNNEFDEIAIERSILQQLLYSRKKSELPNSKIDRTNKTSTFKVLIVAIIMTLFILSATFFGITLKGTRLFGIRNEWIIYLVIASGLFLVLFWILLQYHKLRKIKYKELEAEFNDEEDNSGYITNLINKFVDEVLYFFECVNIELVIFEDLDRLPTTEIFVKLRELNTIINSSNKKAKKVTFLYAVRDDLFKTEEERAKFFEFILPVVPVVNPVTTKNILDNLLDKLKKRNPKMELSSKFLKGISVYIPDMRVLKNTFNDYVMMFHKIFEDDKAGKFLEPNKLFALCLYKNLFPYDYALLEKNKGLIPRVVNVVALRAQCLDIVKDSIIKIENRLKELHAESLNSFAELKSMFIGQLAQLPYGDNQGEVDPLSITSFEKLNYASLRHPIPKVRQNYYGHNVEWKSVALPKGQAELLTSSGERYLDKERKIKEREESGIEKLKTEIARLEKQRQDISQWSFAQIISQIGIETCFSNKLKDDYVREINATMPADDKFFLDCLSSIPNSTIDEKTVAEIAEKYKRYKTSNIPEEQVDKQINYLRFLVVQNYIDEHYIEYTSNYKSDSLSVSDTLLVQSIQQRQDVEFNSIVENIPQFVIWLDEGDFLHHSILIQPILSNIEEVFNLKQQDKNDKKFENLMTILSNIDDSIVLDRISEFIGIADDIACEKFLAFIIPRRLSLFEELVSADLLPKEKRDFVLCATIKYVEDFNAYNSNSIISNYISNCPYSMSLFLKVGDEKKVIAFINSISPKIEYLDRESLKNPIQSFIIENKYYSINIHNLEVVFEINDLLEQPEFYTRNFDMIMNSQNDTVISYLTDNINDYVQKVLLNEKVSGESEPKLRVEELVKNENISIPLRKALIAKYKSVFSNISDFNPELFESLLDNNAIDATWKNILFAYEKSGFEIVKSFLQRTDTIIGEFDALDDIADDIKKSFIGDMLKALTPERISTISWTLPTVLLLSDIISPEIIDASLARFIENNKIKYNSDDLSILYGLNDSLGQYVNKFRNEILSEFDVFFAIALPKVTTQQRQVIQNGYYVNQPITQYSAKENAQRIIASVIACCVTDIAIKNRLIESCSMIIDISNYANVYKDYIVINKQSVPAGILWQFTNVPISKYDKLAILEICNYGTDEKGKLQPDKIKEFLKSCGEPFIELFGESKKACLEKTSQNQKLLLILRNNKIVDFKKAKLKDEYKVDAI